MQILKHNRLKVSKDRAKFAVKEDLYAEDWTDEEFDALFEMITKFNAMSRKQVNLLSNVCDEKKKFFNSVDDVCEK